MKSVLARTDVRQDSDRNATPDQRGGIEVDTNLRLRQPECVTEMLRLRQLSAEQEGDVGLRQEVPDPRRAQLRSGVERMMTGYDPAPGDTCYERRAQLLRQLEHPRRGMASAATGKQHRSVGTVEQARTGRNLILRGRRSARNRNDAPLQSNLPCQNG